MTERETHVYREIGGQSLELEVIGPAGNGDGTATSCAVFFHGGAWRLGDRSQFLPQCRALAERGATAVTVSYRLVTEGGETTPVDCTNDAVHAIAWVREHTSELGIDGPGAVQSRAMPGGNTASSLPGRRLPKLGRG